MSLIIKGIDLPKDDTLTLEINPYGEVRAYYYEPMWGEPQAIQIPEEDMEFWEEGIKASREIMKILEEVHKDESNEDLIELAPTILEAEE